LQTTPNATTDQLQFKIPAGSVVYFLGEQPEAWNRVDQSGEPIPTSPIRCAGAATTRQADRLYDSSAFTRPYLNGKAFTTAMRVQPFGFSSTGVQQIAVANNGSTTELAAIRLNTDNFIRRFITATTGGTGNSASVAVYKPEINRDMWCGISIKPGSSYVMGSNCAYVDASHDKGDPSGLTTMIYGARDTSGTEAFFGMIYEIKHVNGYVSPIGMGGLFTRNGDKALGINGQSNGEGYSKTTPTPISNYGELAMIAQMDAIEPNVRHYVVNGATGGGALFQADNGGFGYQIATDGSKGTNAVRSWNTHRAFLAGGGAFYCGIYSGHESHGSHTQAEYETGLTTSLGWHSDSMGGKPVIIDFLGAKSAASSEDTAFNLMRAAQNAITVSNPTKFKPGPDKYHRTRAADGIHLSVASNDGYALQGPLLARAAMAAGGFTVPGGTLGPRISGANRSGTTINITVAPDAGASLTGTEGLAFYDNTTPIAFNSVTVNSNTSITAVLASAPSSGTYTLRMGDGAMSSVTPANVIQDNLGMALRNAVLTL